MNQNGLNENISITGFSCCRRNQGIPYAILETSNNNRPSCPGTPPDDQVINLPAFISTVGSILPFSSGGNVLLDISSCFSPRNVAILGFAASSEKFLPINCPISQLTDLQGFAIIAPRTGTINAIAASATTLSITNTKCPTITAQLYRASVNSNIFFPIPKGFVTFRAPSINTTNGALKSACISFTPQERLLMLFYANDNSGCGTISALLNAGISIT